MRKLNLLATSVCGIVLLSMLVGCADMPLFPGNSRSYKTKKESVKIDIKHKKTPEFAPLLAAAVPIFVDMATKIFKEQMDAEAKKYDQSYIGFKADDAFYESDADNADTAIQNITVTRIAATGGARKEAFNLVMHVARSRDKTAFQLVPDSMEIQYSKAKVPFYQDTVDVEVKIQVDAFWVDKDGNGTSKTVATLDMPFRGIKIGAPASDNKDQVAGFSSGWFTVPRSVIPKSVVTKDKDGNPITQTVNTHGSGNYTITATVEEVDDFGKRVSTASSDFDAERSKIDDAITKILTTK